MLSSLLMQDNMQMISKANFRRYIYSRKIKKADCKKSALSDKRKLAASIGISLFSHPVARALSSAPLSLTSYGNGWTLSVIDTN